MSNEPTVCVCGHTPSYHANDRDNERWGKCGHTAGPGQPACTCREYVKRTIFAARYDSFGFISEEETL